LNHILIARERLDTANAEEECHVRMKVEVRVMHLKPRSPKNNWNEERSLGWPPRELACCTLTLDLWSPELLEKRFLLFEATSFLCEPKEVNLYGDTNPCS
jgi:hypothetical protein